MCALLSESLGWKSGVYVRWKEEKKRTRVDSQRAHFRSSKVELLYSQQVRNYHNFVSRESHVMWWRKSGSFSHHHFTKTFLSILSSIPVESEFWWFNRESINDALITVRLLFRKKLDSRRNRAVVSTCSDTFQLIDSLSRATTRGKGRWRGGICVRVEGNKRSSLFRALDIFLYDRSCVFLRENACAIISTLRFFGRGGRKREETGGTIHRCAWNVECEAAWAESWGGEEKKKRVKSRTMIFYLFLKYVNRFKVLVAHVDVRYIRGTFSGTSVRLAE